MAPGLLVVWSGDGPRHDRHRLVAGEPFVFGRALADPSDDRISAKHASIHFDGRRVTINDLGSRNGTFVNGFAIVGIKHVTAPAVIRTGRTVSIAVPDLERLDAACAPDVEETGALHEVEAAALAEENLTIEARPEIGIVLARRYAKAVGGEVFEFDPARTDGLDAALTGVRPTTVILMLATSALPMADMPTVELWLETDVRFVTVMMYDAMPLSLMPERLVERLRRRVVTVYPPYVEITRRVFERVRERSPTARIHATAPEAMLLEARVLEHDVLIERFEVGLGRWLAAGRNTLRGADIARDLAPRDPSHCIVGP